MVLGFSPRVPGLVITFATPHSPMSTLALNKQMRWEKSKLQICQQIQQTQSGETLGIQIIQRILGLVILAFVSRDLLIRFESVSTEIELVLRV